MAALAPYLKVSTPRQQPGPGLTVNVQVVLDTPRKVVAFALDMARSVSVIAWWHRPAVFIGLLVWGVGQLFTRGDP